MVRWTQSVRRTAMVARKMRLETQAAATAQSRPSASSRYASRYRALVWAMTSAGRRGAGGCLFQFRDVRESRPDCLFKLGLGRPGSYWLRGQERGESGGRTSSIHIGSPGEGAIAYP